MQAIFREVMIWLCFSSVGILLLLAGVFFWLYRIFAHKPERLDTVPASLVSTKYKKNLPIYEKWKLFGPRRVETVIRHYCKGIYEYRVEDKKFRVRHVEFVPPDKMPETVKVTYLKSCPRIACVITLGHDPFFDTYAMVALILAVFALVSGCRILFFGV